MMTVRMDPSGCGMLEVERGVAVDRVIVLFLVEGGAVAVSETVKG